MRKISVVLLSVLLVGFFAGVLYAAEEAAAPAAAQVDEETEYSYGTVGSVTGDQLVVSEYDFEKDADVNVTYTVNADTKFENINGLSDIAAGDSVEIDYLVKDGKNIATLISVEKMTQPEEAPAAAPAAEEAPAMAAQPQATV